jgi:hypothetical protein
MNLCEAVLKMQQGRQSTAMIVTALKTALMVSLTLH